MSSTRRSIMYAYPGWRCCETGRALRAWHRRSPMTLAGFLAGELDSEWTAQHVLAFGEPVTQM